MGIIWTILRNRKKKKKEEEEEGGGKTKKGWKNTYMNKDN